MSWSLLLNQCYKIRNKINQGSKMFNLFRRKDPICGMKEEKGEGIEKYGKWFCNNTCLKEYEKQHKLH